MFYVVVFLCRYSRLVFCFLYKTRALQSTWWQRWHFKGSVSHHC